jgi:predicted nucleic acid-binding Zn ribbon protein
MNKTEVNLSQQDKNLLEKAKKETRSNLIIWIGLTIFMFVMFVLVYTIQLPLDEAGIIILFFLLILMLPTYAIIKIYGFYKTINDALLSNKKLIIEAETYTDFPMNSDQGTQFFKDDGTSYKFFRLDFKPFENSIFPMRTLPKPSQLRLEVAQPSGILLKYEMLSTQQNYSTKIDLFTKEDKKIIIDGIITFTKVSNFAIFPILAIVFGFASDWKISEGSSILVVMFILINVLWNFCTLIWYWMIKRKFQNPNKFILTGIITDKLIQNGKYPKTYIYFGLEKIDVSNNYSEQTYEIGNTIALHYFQKANKEKGSLIRVEKLI